MIIVLLSFGAFLPPGIAPITVEDTKDLSRAICAISAIVPFPIACNLFCIQGYKCAIVEPQNCVGCKPTPRCVQKECDTSCVLPCPFLSKCVLVATNCCPKPTCRRNPIIFTIKPPEDIIDFTIRPPKVILNPGDPVAQIP
ncbi:hypothetical protein ANCCAN_10854 [Ancylostoma caninum]|uniref:Uncharacterized protein n=1 Tax=Ancylostoma caninum TaxID=29170 RepID=A0A368GJY1_ANCCA|nr:hypothetical protein ANCCAN_10854 [Ancylostoma caninum]